MFVPSFLRIDDLINNFLEIIHIDRCARNSRAAAESLRLTNEKQKQAQELGEIDLLEKLQ